MNAHTSRFHKSLATTHASTCALPARVLHTALPCRHFSCQAKLFAGAANALRVRITACTNYSRTEMKEAVIRLILTNHQIRIAVVAPVVVEVMNNGFRRQRLSERGFGDPSMLATVITSAVRRFQNRAGSISTWLRTEAATPTPRLGDKRLAAVLARRHRSESSEPSHATPRTKLPRGLIAPPHSESTSTASTDPLTGDDWRQRLEIAKLIDRLRDTSLVGRLHRALRQIRGRIRR